MDHDRPEHVKHDETITADQGRTETVKANETVTIGMNRAHTVGLNEELTVGVARTHAVGQRRRSPSVQRARFRLVRRSRSGDVIIKGQKILQD